MDKKEDQLYREVERCLDHLDSIRVASGEWYEAMKEFGDAYRKWNDYQKEKNNAA